MSQVDINASSIEIRQIIEEMGAEREFKLSNSSKNSEKEERIQKIESKLNIFQERLDRFEERLDRFQERIEYLEKDMKEVKSDIKIIKKMLSMLLKNRKRPKFCARRTKRNQIFNSQLSMTSPMNSTVEIDLSELKFQHSLLIEKNSFQQDNILQKVENEKEMNILKTEEDKTQN